jgi:hypothetical protein
VHDVRRCMMDTMDQENTAAAASGLSSSGKAAGRSVGGKSRRDALEPNSDLVYGSEDGAEESAEDSASGASSAEHAAKRAAKRAAGRGASSADGGASSADGGASSADGGASSAEGDASVGWKHYNKTYINFLCAQHAADKTAAALAVGAFEAVSVRLTSANVPEGPPHLQLPTGAGGAGAAAAGAGAAGPGALASGSAAAEQARNAAALASFTAASKAARRNAAELRQAAVAKKALAAVKAALAKAHAAKGAASVAGKAAAAKAAPPGRLDPAVALTHFLLGYVRRDQLEPGTSSSVYGRLKRGMSMEAVAAQPLLGGLYPASGVLETVRFNAPANEQKVQERRTGFDIGESTSVNALPTWQQLRFAKDCGSGRALPHALAGTAYPYGRPVADEFDLVHSGATLPVRLPLQPPPGAGKGAGAASASSRGPDSGPGSAAGEVSADPVGYADDADDASQEAPGTGAGAGAGADDASAGGGASAGADAAVLAAARKRAALPAVRDFPLAFSTLSTDNAAAAGTSCNMVVLLPETVELLTGDKVEVCTLSDMRGQTPRYRFHVTAHRPGHGAGAGAAATKVLASFTVEVMGVMAGAGGSA